MALFGRKKAEMPTPAVIDEGHSNLAKQVKYQSLLQDDQASSGSSQPTPSTLSASTFHAAKGSPIYEFSTTMVPTVQRSRRWYFGMAIFFSALVALNIVLHLYMSAIVVALLAIVLFVNVSRKPMALRVGFFANGVKLNDDFYPWSRFEKFWILFEPPALQELHLKKRTRLINEIVIELTNQDPLKIRDLLLPWLPEDSTKELSRVDLVSRVLKL
jgi:hypothetical protein